MPRENLKRRDKQQSSVINRLAKFEIVEVLKLIKVNVGGAKESLSKDLNRVEHLAEPSSYGLVFRRFVKQLIWSVRSFYVACP